jgi:hypothetical protein
VREIKGTTGVSIAGFSLEAEAFLCGVVLVRGGEQLSVPVLPEC